MVVHREREKNERQMYVAKNEPKHKMREDEKKEKEEGMLFPSSSVAKFVLFLSRIYIGSRGHISKIT